MDMFIVGRVEAGIIEFLKNGSKRWPADFTQVHRDPADFAAFSKAIQTLQRKKLISLSSLGRAELTTNGRHMFTILEENGMYDLRAED